MTITCQSATPSRTNHSHDRCGYPHKVTLLLLCAFVIASNLGAQSLSQSAESFDGGEFPQLAAKSFAIGVSGNSVDFQHTAKSSSLFSVTVGTNIPGLTFSVDGASYSSTQTFQWSPSSSHTISTSSPQSGGTGKQFVWSNWSDGGSLTHTVTPAGSSSYTANFTEQYLLTMSAGAGGTVSPQSGWYDVGTFVLISATARSGYSFTGWSGTGSGSYSGANNPAMVTINGPVTETANFSNLVSVTVGTFPAGLLFSVDGASYSSKQTFQWTPGSSHEIAASSPQGGGTGKRYVWTSWSDGGDQTHTVTPSGSSVYTANFGEQYFLTMFEVTGGTVSPRSGWYDVGTGVQIAATANRGYTFGGWTGSGSGSYTGASNPATVIMNGPVSETASFANSVSVTVGTSPGGLSFSVDGTFYSSTQTFQWTVGSSHAVSTSSPQSGGAGTRYVWSSWSDGGMQAHTVTPTGSSTYIANFAEQYLLTMNASVGGTVTPQTGWYDGSSKVSIAATAGSGYTFVGWTGTGSGSYSGTGNPASVTMNGPVDETAGFRSAVSAVDRGIPTRTQLMQNFPNPFNPSTSFELRVASVGIVRLSVMDVFGREIALLVNEVKPPGTYTVTWNAANVASGVYFSRMLVRQSDDELSGQLVEMKKLIVVK